MLKPMSEADFLVFKEASIAGYARSNVSSGRWPADGALQIARQEFDRLMPQGFSTSGHHFLHIADDAGQIVGHLWWAEVDRSGLREAYVYDIRIDEAHRRQGHAERALRELEAQAVALGLPQIGLHVFACNEGAKTLYERLGYEVAGFNMRRPLTG